MLFYFGIDLLKRLRAYYEPRLCQALERGYDQAGAKYHWLYCELHERVSMLRQTEGFLTALPAFMTGENAEAAISYVVRYTGAWFKRERIGEFEGSEAGSNPYFKDSNRYWVEFHEVVEAIDTTYDCTLLPLLYVDLCEYVMRCLRLYFFVREMQFKPIDRGNFDTLMGRQESLKASA